MRFIVLLCFFTYGTVQADPGSEYVKTDKELAPAEEEKILNDEYEQFKVKFDRQYNQNEDKVHRAAFIENMKELKKQYKKGNTFVGVNRFADYTYEEKKHMTNPGPYAPVTDDDTDTPTQTPARLPRPFKIPSPPKRNRRQGNYVFDLRTDSYWKQCVPAVRDQGQCGACIPFALLGALDIQFCRDWNMTEPLLLSEQDIMDCCRDIDCIYGGSRKDIFQYVRNNGVRALSVAPYRGRKDGCPADKSGKEYPMESYVQLNESQVDLMESFLHQAGPFTAGVRVNSLLMSYNSGIMIDPVCQENIGSHALTVIGYGTENGVDYWIVRNSWAKSWGDGGYGKIQKGVNTCGIESSVIAPISWGTMWDKLDTTNCPNCLWYVRDMFDKI